MPSTSPDEMYYTELELFLWDVQAAHHCSTGEGLVATAMGAAQAMAHSRDDETAKHGSMVAILAAANARLFADMANATVRLDDDQPLTN